MNCKVLKISIVLEMFNHLFSTIVSIHKCKLKCEYDCQHPKVAKVNIKRTAKQIGGKM